MTWFNYYFAFWIRTFCHISISIWLLVVKAGVASSIAELVGNKAKGQISKQVFPENKARQIFWKTNISYPLIRTVARSCFILLPSSKYWITEKNRILYSPQRRIHNRQTSKMELFAEIVNGFNGFQPSTIFANSSVLDVWQSSEYTSGCLVSYLCRDGQISEIHGKLPINLCNHSNFTKITYQRTWWTLTKIFLLIYIVIATYHRQQIILWSVIYC